MGSIPVSWCPQRELMLLPLAGLIHMGALMVILRPSDDKRCDLHLSFVAWQTVRSLRKDAEQLLALQVSFQTTNKFFTKFQ